MVKIGMELLCWSNETLQGLWTNDFPLSLSHNYLHNRSPQTDTNNSAALGTYNVYWRGEGV